MPSEPHVNQETAAQLRSIIERIESMHEEKKQLESDISDIYSEAKGTGFDVKAIKAIVAERRKDPHELSEAQIIIATYRAAILSAELAAIHKLRPSDARASREDAANSHSENNALQDA